MTQNTSYSDSAKEGRKSDIVLKKKRDSIFKVGAGQSHDKSQHNPRFRKGFKLRTSKNRIYC
jgi:hypothetical protein